MLSHQHITPSLPHLHAPLQACKHPWCNIRLYPPPPKGAASPTLKDILRLQRPHYLKFLEERAGNVGHCEQMETNQPLVSLTSRPWVPDCAAHGVRAACPLPFLPPRPPAPGPFTEHGRFPQEGIPVQSQLEHKALISKGRWVNSFLFWDDGTSQHIIFSQSLKCQSTTEQKKGWSQPLLAPPTPHYPKIQGPKVSERPGHVSRPSKAPVGPLLQKRRVTPEPLPLGTRYSWPGGLYQLCKCFANDRAPPALSFDFQSCVVISSLPE